MNQLTPKEESQAVNRYVQRRLIAEQLRRDRIEGKRVDVADVCVCRCGQVHYRKREAKP